MTDIVEEINSALTNLPSGKCAYEDGYLTFNNNDFAFIAADSAACEALAASPDLLTRAAAEIVRLREWLKLIEEKGHIIEEGYPSFWSTQALGGRSVADVEP